MKYFLILILKKLGFRFKVPPSPPIIKVGDIFLSKAASSVITIEHIDEDGIHAYDVTFNIRYDVTPGYIAERYYKL